MSEYATGLFENDSSYVIPPANADNYLESIVKLCKEEKIEVIAPGSEPEIEKIAENQKIFEENGIKTLTNTWDVIQKCRDKFSIIEVLNSKGISTPESFLFKSDLDVERIKKFPIIIKPRLGSGSRNVFLANDKEETIFFANYLKKYGSEPIIQEHIGDYENEFTIGVLYADNGNLITSIAMKRVLNGGLSVRQSIVNQETNEKFVISSGISQGFFDDFEEIKKIGVKIARALNSDGPINIQCRKTADKIIPFEVNPRFSGTTASRSLVGYNEPDILCKYRLFNEKPSIKSHKIGFVLKELSEKFISIEDTKKIPRI